MASIGFPWLRPLWQQVLSAAAGQRLPHAIGLHYNQDLGIDSFLNQLAAYLLCNSVSKQASIGASPLKKACGTCKSCLLWQAGTHPDYLRIEPEQGKQIGVDLVREIAHKVQQTASQGGNKVVQIIAADRMTPQAANALLKTLEEPPENTYFQIAAVRYTQLLPTIRSRLLSYPVPQPSITEIAAWLKQHAGIDVADTLLLERAQSAPLQVLAELQANEQSEQLLARLCRGEFTVPKELESVQQQLKIVLKELQLAHRETLQGRIPAVLSANVRNLAALTTVSKALENAYRSGIHILRTVQNAGVNPQILIAAWSADVVRSLNVAAVKKG
ncbi:MAG: hypothetical protein LAT53_01745 [Idiomarina sp.]|nr:hypothetical protein [Idiomarina sp.]